MLPMRVVLPALLPAWCMLRGITGLMLVLIVLLCIHVSACTCVNLRMSQLAGLLLCGSSGLALYDFVLWD
jgi:hypothetical protein